MEKKNESLHIDGILMGKASLVIRAINHKLRQQILLLIHQKKRISVTEIYTKLKLEQSFASQHLAIMRAARIVTTEREGKTIYYSANYPRIEKIQQQVEKLNSINK